MFFHRPLMHIDYYLRAYEYVSEQEFDVYHAHDLNTLPVAARLARKKRRTLVYDSHELYSEISTLSRTERRVWKTVEPRLIRHAASVITVCESIAGELSERYRIPAPTILLNCPPRARTPAAEDRYRLRRSLGLDGDERAIVLYQGGFAPNRGLEELVAAARYFDGGVLVLMGSGKIEEELRALIERERLAEQVLIHPAVPSHEVIPYAAGAEIGVIPYKGVGLNNYYTTPNKLFDYMAAGVAVAGSRFPEIVRFVEGLGIGVTFNPESPLEIAYSINYVLDDRSILEHMRANAREASGRFVWEAEQQKLLDIYGSAVRSEPLAEVA
jgi:glycosyltransferase involved in cell wall biosynthesis